MFRGTEEGSSVAGGGGGGLRKGLEREGDPSTGRCKDHRQVLLGSLDCR